MSPDDIARISGVAGVRQDNAASLRLERSAAAPAPVRSDAAASDAAPQIDLGAASGVDVRTAPVDAERVAEIRQAIQQGNYPLVPAKIADAMIAAPLLLSAQG